MSRVAVLVTSSNNEPTVHVLGPDGLHSGPLNTLKTVAQKAKAKGSALLICMSKLEKATIPETVTQPLPYLDAQGFGKVMVHPSEHPPTLMAGDDQNLLPQVTQLGRAAGLRFSQVIPLEAATLAAVPDTIRSVVIVQVFPTSYLSSTVSPVDVRTQSSKTRQTPQHIAESALKRLQASGDHPQAVIVHHVLAPHDPVEIPGTDVLTFDLETIMGAALTLGNSVGEPDPTAPITIVRGMRRSLQNTTGLSPALIGALAAAAVINGALMVGTNIIDKQVTHLEDQKMALQLQADQVRTLRASNDQLQTRVTQARQLTSDKGPLATDLPLISDRLMTTDTSFTSLSGPNVGTPTDALPFGGTVGNIYTVAARSKSPQNLADAFQKAGLRADVQRISCEQSACDVGLRIAIAPSPTPTQAVAPTTGGTP